MSHWKNFAAHLLTAALTLGAAFVLFGGRPDERRKSPREESNEAPRPRSSEEPTTNSQQAAAKVIPFRLPTVTAPVIPDDVLKTVDADGQVNIRVYAAVNKSVVNITTAADNVGLFGEESSGGTGSGLLIDQQGHILTNYHVIESASSVQVTLFDGSTHEASVIGADASNDVAVVRIKVDSDRLFPVAFGDSSKLMVGQKILALGNPFGLERTLTTGIVSALDRSLRAKNSRMIKGVIQTDAAVNPGNSGGPLLNSRGEVVGINTAIYSQVGQSAGISFAVPINAIVRILKPLIEHGRVIRADLGVTRVFTTNEGLLVLGLTEGGPAEVAGIQAIQVKVIRYGNSSYRRLDPDSADLITAIDGRKVRNVDELLTEVEAHAPGDVITVNVVRDGKRLDVPVTLGKS